MEVNNNSCTVRKDALLYHLDVVSKALGKEEQFLGIKITFINTSIKLEATNGQIYIMSLVPDANSFMETKSIVVNGSLLVNIIKKLDDDYVYLEITDKLLIKAGKSKFSLTLLDGNKFPLWEIWNHKVNFSLVGLEFKNLVKKTIIAASTSESRMALSGVNFRIKDNNLYAYATDSFRLAKGSLNVEAVSDVDIIVPASSLNELIKIMYDSYVGVFLGNNYASFHFGSTEFHTRLVNAKFPDVDRLIPTSFATTKIVNRQKLISALERASIMVDNSSSQVVKIDFTNTNLATISTIYNQVGQAQEEVITKGETHEIVMAMSYKYLLDALKTFSCDEVKLNITGETQPMTITAVEDDKENLIQLVLPVRM
jgi:DNA polymerase-3 subunit beta